MSDNKQGGSDETEQFERSKAGSKDPQKYFLSKCSRFNSQYSVGFIKQRTADLFFSHNLLHQWTFCKDPSFIKVPKRHASPALCWQCMVCCGCP